MAESEGGPSPEKRRAARSLNYPGRPLGQGAELPQGGWAYQLVPPGLVSVGKST